jgi:hypothetical protein
MVFAQIAQMRKAFGEIQLNDEASRCSISSVKRFWPTGDDTAPPEVASIRHTERSAPVLALQLLLFLLSTIFTFSSQDSVGGDASSSQLAKLFICLSIASIGGMSIVKSTAARNLFVTTVSSGLTIIMYYLLCVPLLLLSNYPMFSALKLVPAVLVFSTMLLLVPQYGKFGLSAGYRLFARHLLYFYALLIVFGLFFLLRNGTGNLRFAPTGGVTHATLMSGVIGMGLIHAFFYKKTIEAKRLIPAEALCRMVTILGGVVLLPLLDSRGTFVALFGAAVGSLAFDTYHDRIRSMIILITLPALGILIWPIIDHVALEVATRGESLDDLATGRTEIWHFILSNLRGWTSITGFGFAITFPNLSFEINYGEIWGAHNAYLQSWTSAGVLGFGLFCLYVLKSILAPIFKSSNGNYYRSKYTFCTAVFFAINSFVESTFGVNTTTAFTILFVTQAWFFANSPANRAYARGGWRGLTDVA